MKLFTESAIQDIERKVGEAEAGTSAEIVVAMAKKSGSYNDMKILIGAAAAVIFLAVGFYSKWEFNQYFMLPDAVAVGLLFAWLSRWTPWLFMFLTRKRRRDEQMRIGSLAAFMELHVSATHARNGILFYISLLENKVLIVPDLGIEGKIPGAEWNTMLHRLGRPRGNPEFLKCFLETLDCAGQVLSAPFPPGEKNPNEIPDRPRMLP